MAIETHVAIIGPTQVPNSGTGDIKVKDSRNYKLLDAKVHSTEMRVLEDVTDIPNSEGNPTIKDYILAEAGDDYQLVHLDQTYVITAILP